MLDLRANPMSRQITLPARNRRLQVVADVELEWSETAQRHRRRQRGWWVITALGVTVALGTGSWILVANVVGGRSTPAASGADKGIPHGPPPTGDPAELAAEQRVYVVTEKLQIISEDDDAYASTAVAPPRLIIYIYRSSAPTTVSERDYRAVVPADIALEFLPALMSLKQTQQLQALVIERTKWLTDHGVEISSLGGSGRGGPYVIGYAERTPPDDSLLRPFEIFGTGTVVFEHMAPGTRY